MRIPAQTNLQIHKYAFASVWPKPCTFTTHHTHQPFSTTRAQSLDDMRRGARIWKCEREKQNTKNFKLQEFPWAAASFNWDRGVASTKSPFFGRRVEYIWHIRACVRFVTHPKCCSLEIVSLVADGIAFSYIVV